MKTLFLLFILLAKMSFCQCPIIPTPSSYKNLITEYKLSSFDWILNPKVPPQLREYFDKELKDKYKLRQFVTKDPKPFIQFVKIDTSISSDFYAINIDSKKIKISYTSEASCFYAMNSFFQLIFEKNGEYFVQNCELSDYPKFEWRGLHLDVSRHFFTVDEVKRYIDLMAFYKFNTFHWHLTDDQGWRIEIKKFPKLTQVGAWRDSTINKHYTTIPRSYTVEKYGGFYTQEQIKEVVKYAQEKYVTIVPEIEMPGHARAALAAYPEFSCTGEQQGVHGIWGVFDDIYCSKKESIDFNKAILDEVLELFPSQFIHVGGDEAPKESWKKCPNCQRVIQENHLKDEHELQSYFIRQIDTYLTSKGRKLIGWDEILEGGLSPNASVMSWRGIEGGIEAVKQNHSVVMSPGSHCYFDHYQSRNPNEPIAIGGFTPIEKVYEFNPIPPNLSPEQEKLILGAQANLWTEYIPDMKQLEYMTYPRALALSEVLWSVNKSSFEDFQNILLTKHLKILSERGVNYSKALFYPEIKIERKDKDLSYFFYAPKSTMTYYFSSFFNGTRNKLYDEKGLAVDSLKLENTAGHGNIFKEFPLSMNLKYSISCFDKRELISYNTFNYKIHAGLGLPIKFVSEPNKLYANNKDLALVDGIIGRSPWNSSEWLGFDTNTIILEMDFGMKKNVKTVSLNFLDDASSWIHVPQKIDVYTSENGKKWKKVLSTNLESQNILEIYKEAKFIRFVIETKKQIPDGSPGAGKTPWTFMDEIVLDLE